MVDLTGTPEQQIEQMEELCKSEAETLSKEQLIDALHDVNELKTGVPSEKAIADRADGLQKSVNTARDQFVQSGGDSKLRQPLLNLIRRHTLLVDLKKKVTSDIWKREAEEEQRQRRQAAQIEDYAREQHQQYRNAQPSNHGPPQHQAIARGPRAVGTSSSRGHLMVTTANKATKPNPSSVNTNAYAIRQRTHEATREMVTKALDIRSLGSLDGLIINREEAQEAFQHATGHGGGGSRDTQICSLCKKNWPLDQLQVHEVGYICDTCQQAQAAELRRRATRSATIPHYTNNFKTKQQYQQPNQPRPVGGNNFYSGGAGASAGGGHLDTSQIQKPKVKQQRQQPRSNYTPLTLTRTNGGTAVLRGDNQQQQRQYDDFQTGHNGGNKERTVLRRGRQRQLNEVGVDTIVDTHGTDANPITLGDSDDDEDEDGDGSAMTRAAAAAARADATERNIRQRITRLGSGAINSSIVARLQGLSCLMPPGGGPGAVEFTAADLGRLGPDEFLNDTAIDYYLRWLRAELERERPQDAQRCYFFNSFFYKKLTEKNANSTGGGGGGSGGGAAGMSYAKVKNWTRGIDIFAKDYVFVPIHDHLHWSLMIICHPGAELNKPAAKKRPSSATGSGNSLKKRFVGSDVVILDGATADAEEETEEIELEEEIDPRLTPTPEPFFLHLDSLAGGHSPDIIAKVLRLYLKCEWDARIEDPKAPEDSVPKKWAEEARAKAEAATERKKAKEKGKETATPAAAEDNDEDKNEETPNGAAGPSSAPVSPSRPKRFFTRLVYTKMPVPKQDNHCDCGLFVCAFVEFFTAALPKSLNVLALKTLKERYNKDGIDLWEGTMREESEEPAWYPGFLTKHWFKHENASNLRWELLKMVLVHMAQAAGIMDAAENITLEQRKESVSTNLANDLAAEIMDAKKDQQTQGEYIRPTIWRLHAEESKRNRAESRKQRAEELKNRQLAAKLQREEEERRNTRLKTRRTRHIIGDGSSSSSSDDDDDEEEEPEKAAEVKGKEKQQLPGGGGGGSNLAAALFNVHHKDFGKLPTWEEIKSPGFANPQESPDEDFKIDLGDSDSDDGDDADAGGNAGGGGDGAAPDFIPIKKLDIDPESGDIDIMPEERTPATEWGRRFAFQGASIAAQAAVAAVAATAPSPTQAAVLDGNPGSSGDNHEEEQYHDAEEDQDVDIVDEDYRLIDPHFDLFDNLGGGGGNGDGKDDNISIDDAGALKGQQQHNPMSATNTAQKPLPKNPRRSKAGQQMAKAVLNEAMENAKLLINSNIAPPDLNDATKCIINSERDTTRRQQMVKSASLVLEYKEKPSFEIQLHGHDALTRIYQWYLLWGHSLAENCVHDLPEGAEKASQISAERMNFLLDATGDGGGGGGAAQDLGAAAHDDGKKGAVHSLQTTEEIPVEDDGLKEETSPFKEPKPRAKGQQGQGQGQGGGSRGAAAGASNVNFNNRSTRAKSKHFYYDEETGAMIEKKGDVIEINDDEAEEEEGHWRRSRARPPAPPAGAAAAKKKPRNTTANNTTNATTNGASGGGWKRKPDKSNIGLQNLPDPYADEYAFIDDDESSDEDLQQQQHQKQNQKRQKKQQKISSAAATKFPPVSPRSNKAKMQKGARTQHGRDVKNLSANLMGNLKSMKGNSAGKNIHRRGGGRGGQGKIEEINLVESPPASPIL